MTQDQLSHVVKGCLSDPTNVPMHHQNLKTGQLNATRIAAPTPWNLTTEALIYSRGTTLASVFAIENVQPTLSNSMTRKESIDWVAMTVGCTEQKLLCY